MARTPPTDLQAALAALSLGPAVALAFPVAMVLARWTRAGLGRRGLAELVVFVALLLCGAGYVRQRGGTERER